jgi:rRNA processing protein Gar1
MKKLLSIAAVLSLSGAIAATAAASLRTYIVGTKYAKGVGTVASFTGTVKKPYKIILYCEGVNARCATKVVCARGTKAFTQTRSALTPGTWNLKKPTWYRTDSCRFTATIKSGARNARVTVQATVRS